MFVLLTYFSPNHAISGQYAIPQLTVTNTGLTVVLAMDMWLQGILK